MKRGYGDGGQVLGQQTRANDARFRQASAAPVPLHSRVNNRQICLLSIAPSDFSLNILIEMGFIVIHTIQFGLYLFVGIIQL